MTATLESPPTPPREPRSLLLKEPNAARRQRVDSLVKYLLVLAMTVASLPLILILFQVLREGLAVVSWEFITSVEFPYSREGGGYASGFVGTGIMVGWAALMAIPTGIFAAVYLVEVGSGWFAAVIRFFTDVMTGIPSVFVGLAVYALIIYSTPMTFGAFPGALALAIIMLPIVVRSSEEILKTVPDELRQGSLAMGARQWQTTVKVVLPAAAPGLATGAMLAVARAAGEAAPLILTAFGNNVQIITDLFNEPIMGIPHQVYDGARQPFAPGIQRAWGGALCLMVVVLLFTVSARWLGAKFTKTGR